MIASHSFFRRPFAGGRGILTVGAVVVGLLAAGPASAFNFFDVAKRAKALAAESYKPANLELPRELRELKYVNYQQITSKPDQYLWSDGKLPFQIAFNHMGMRFDQPVKLHEVDAQGVREIKFDPAMFNYGDLKVDPAAFKGLGFAGFRVMYPINDPAKRDDEIASFLGASYFRVVGKGQTYGLSARGLAIDTALASGEEFPRFREFWIARPAAKEKHVVIYALLDSPRATGAYRFTFTPGEDTQVDVRGRVYLRSNVGKLGIAATASMFLYGANQPAPGANLRPELHDSDGLAIQAGNGEWIWRPVNNPRRLATSSYAIENPRGFGLLQRERDFDNYQDLDDRYETRPSLWIVPKGDWGKGRVELVEIPTNNETNDNIVSLWVPEQTPKPGEAFDFEYAMYWTRDEARHHDPKVAWVAQTRRSTGEIRGADLIRRPDDTIAFSIDFEGPVFKELPADVVIGSNVSSNGNAEIVEATTRRNPVTEGWRLLLRIRPKDAAKPVELRAQLRNGEAILSETWSYQLPLNENAQ